MSDDSKSKVLIRKIIGIILIVLLISGVGVMASNVKIRSIKIILSNGYEMDITTSKTKVSEILSENHIVLLPEENVIPNLEKEIADNNTIRIVKYEEEDVKIAQTTKNTTTEEILDTYDSIIEKIETVEEKIPFETITKDVSGDESATKDTVVQEGKEGLKEVTYKVKYQNEVEIERIELSSNILEEPVDKIIEVRNANVTSRYGSDRSSATSYGTGVWTYSDEDFDLLCAITAAESGSSYEGALAVITCACNRTESSAWKKNGSDPLSQYKAKGQFCYSINSSWKKRLNGKYGSFVAEAVKDALNGKRNHKYLSFRAASTGRSGEYIGGNVYFNAM